MPEIEDLPISDLVGGELNSESGFSKVFFAPAHKVTGTPAPPSADATATPTQTFDDFGVATGPVTFKDDIESWIEIEILGNSVGVEGEGKGVIGQIRLNTMLEFNSLRMNPKALGFFRTYMNVPGIFLLTPSSCGEAKPVLVGTHCAPCYASPESKVSFGKTLEDTVGLAMKYETRSAPVYYNGTMPGA